VLARRPSILVLDEPTNGLDNETEHQMFELISANKANYLTVVASHHPAVLSYCDRVITL
jgi:ATP-binding cassette, subfamily C, bacterial CydC